MKCKTIKATDLFCGAGGTSTGLTLAARELGLRLDLLAINHWAVAIDTHSANHPAAQHLCESLDMVDPRKVVPGGRLDLLIASPECTHHSIARGGKPVSDQSRASGWHVLRWCEALHIENVLIENVREYREWGPLGANGNPLKKRKGETYQAFLNALRSLGYTVEDRILNAANYGDPTTRERLFILARRGNKKIHWPEPTHNAHGEQTLFGTQPKWKGAREIIDWKIKGESIFTRKRPLSPNTMKRIMAGLKKFGGGAFLVPFFGEYEGKSPRTHSIDDPLPTVTSHGAGALVQPFILNVRGGNDGYLRASSIDEPLPAVTATSPTALVEPFIIPVNHGANDHRSYGLDKPMPTVTSVDAWGLVEPFLIEDHGGDGNERRTRSIDEPLPVIDTANRFGLVQPFLVKYFGTGEVQSIDEPIGTLMSRDHFGLVEPQDNGAVLVDIRFRMLQPHELARAMSFPDDYEFAGTREQKVKQIGNAVPVQLAKALCLTLLS